MILTAYSPRPAPPRKSYPATAAEIQKVRAGIKAARQRRAEMLAPPKPRALSDAELEELKAELKNRVWILE